MSTSSPHVKKANGEGKKTKRTASDSESDSDETSTKPSALAHDKSQTTILKEIKATFDFKGPKDFQKIRILGKGGVGRVYLVQLTGTDKLFAMKVLKQEEMISRNKVRTLQRSPHALEAVFFGSAIANFVWRNSQSLSRQITFSPPHFPFGSLFTICPHPIFPFEM